MDIQLTRTEALVIAERAYGGPSDVLTETRQPREDPASLEWWEADPGRKGNRGWRGRRDWGALYVYLELNRHAVSPLPPPQFPVEFRLRSKAWCRPDKDIIKQGLRHGYLRPVADGEGLRGFHITDDGLSLLRQLFPAAGD